MTKEFIVFRHGQTDWNVERRCQGHIDIPLNETGKKQALALAERLKSYSLDVVYSSDLARARETGARVAQAQHIDLIETKDLRETDMGKVGGMLLDEAIATYGEDLWASFRSRSPEVLRARFPEGESREESMKRLQSFIFKLQETSDYHCIGISTHGGSLRSLLHSFLPDDAEPLKIPNCVAYRLVKKAGSWLVEGPL